MTKTLTIPITLCGLAVLSPSEAEDAGFKSITVGVSTVYELNLLKSMATSRDPKRTCWIAIRYQTVELAVKKKSTKH